MGGMAGKADLGPWGAIGGSLRWHRLPDCMRRRAGSPNLKWIASPCYFQLTLIVTKANAHTTTTTAPHDHVCETIETPARHLWYRKNQVQIQVKIRIQIQVQIQIHIQIQKPTPPPHHMIPSVKPLKHWHATCDLWYRKISFKYRWKYKNKSECDISVSKFLGFKTFPIFWMLSNSV